MTMLFPTIDAQKKKNNTLSYSSRSWFDVVCISFACFFFFGGGGFLLSF